VNPEKVQEFLSLAESTPDEAVVVALEVVGNVCVGKNCSCVQIEYNGTAELVNLIQHHLDQCRTGTVNEAWATHVPTIHGLLCSFITKQGENGTTDSKSEQQSTETDSLGS
jgi:hypothetical protein